MKINNMTKIHIHELTKKEFNDLYVELHSKWLNFLNESKKGSVITENIIKKYPLQYVGYLRESMEYCGKSITDDSYLKRNKTKAKNMMKYIKLYNLNVSHINIMFYGNDKKYHKRQINDAILCGFDIPDEVKNDFKELF